jgi:hypothetical protein
MKRPIILLLISVIIMWGCKEQNKDNSIYIKDRAKNSSKWLYFDDEMDIKSKVTFDTTEFRKVMDNFLPTQRILDLFGGGYQTFYLGLTIHPDGLVGIEVVPDIGRWMGIHSYKYLYREDIELTSEYAIVPQKNNDPRAIRVFDFLYSTMYDYRKIFKGEVGEINGKKVSSLKIFQVDITIDNVKNIIKPWSIKEIDVSIFRPQINSNLSTENYMGYFPALLKENFESISKQIEYPQEAIKRGVRGRVIMKLFYESNGDYAGYQLIKGLGYGCDEAVINAIKTLKPNCYSSGQRCSLIVPFNFGPSDQTPVDIAVKSFEYIPTEKYNQLKLTIINNQKHYKRLNIKYSIYVFLEDKLLFSDAVATPNISEKGFYYWFGGNQIKPGTYNYLISIDPEKVLNDINKANNTLHGTLVVK